MTFTVSRDVLEVFHDSFDRCRDDAGFFDHFYEAFLGSSPEIRSFFDGVHLGRIQAMLKEAIYVVMMVAGGLAGAENRLKTLGKLHDEKGIRRHHYDVWLDRLIESVAASDPYFSPKVAAAWRAVMGGGLEIIRSEAEE